MNTFKSWSKLFILALLVSFAFGCGGGGGGGEVSNNNNTNNQAQTIGNYIDTYDMVRLLDGEWVGISMSGYATGEEGTFHVELSNMSATIWDTQIAGNNGTFYITSRENWRYSYEGYVGYVGLDADAERVTMQHIGSNTWRCEGAYNTVLTIQVLSNSTAMITQEGTAIFGGRFEGHSYRYSVKGTIRKLNADNYEINTTPTPQTNTQPTPQNDTQDNTTLEPQPDTPTDTQEATNSYGINTLEGTWQKYFSNSFGVATDSSGNSYELSLSSAQFLFNNIQSTGSINVTSSTRWNASHNSKYVDSVTVYHQNETVYVQNSERDTWSYTFSNEGTTVTIKFTSNTNADVTETGTLTIGSHHCEYTASYEISKR